MCLAHRHNTVLPVGIEPRTSRFRVWCSTTMPPCSLIWPFHKIGQGQPKVTIYTKYRPESLMLHSTYQVSLKSVYMYVFQRRFLRVFTIYGHGSRLGHVTWTIYTKFGSPFLRMFHMMFGFDWPSSFKGEDIWALWTKMTATTMDARAWVYYKPPWEPLAQVS